MQPLIKETSHQTTMSASGYFPPFFHPILQAFQILEIIRKSSRENFHAINRVHEQLVLYAELGKNTESQVKIIGGT